MYFAICLNRSLLYLKYFLPMIDLIKYGNLFVLPIRKLLILWMDWDFNFFYLRNRGVQWVLCTVFGVTQSQVSNYLRFSRRILIKLLSKTNIAKTSVPYSADIEKNVEAVSCRHPILGQRRVWGTMDILKILLQQTTKISIQLRFYNGWTHDHYITNLFVFAPDGTIRFFVLIVQVQFTILR